MGCPGFCPSQVSCFRFTVDSENLPLQFRKAFSRNTKLEELVFGVPTPKTNSSPKYRPTVHGFGLSNWWRIAAVVGLDSLPRYAFCHLLYFHTLTLLFPASVQVIDSFHSPSPRICFIGRRTREVASWPPNSWSVTGWWSIIFSMSQDEIYFINIQFSKH